MRSALLCVPLLAPLLVLGQSSGAIFGPAVTYGIGGQNPDAMAMADVNGDGKLDLVVVSECTTEPINGCGGGLVSVLLGNGDGTFQTAVTYASGGSNAVSVLVSDVNGDGKLDLLVGNESACESLGCLSNGAVGVLLGNGDGTFQPAASYDSGGAFAYTVVSADVNDDGKPDLLVMNRCPSVTNCTNVSSVVGVLLGNGDGTFQPAVSYGSGGETAYKMAVADVNGDGKIDLLVNNDCGDITCNNGAVGVLLGNGDGTFLPAVIYDSGGYGPSQLVVADVNGDGKSDLLMVNECATTNNCRSSGPVGNGAVGVLLGNGDGSFQSAVSYDSGGNNAIALTVADVNGDGRPDLLLTNLCDHCISGLIGVLLGNGDGTFEPVVSYGSGGYEAALPVVVADLNGDGKADVVVANSEAANCSTGSNCNGVVGVLVGNGDGTFQPAVSYGSGGEFPQSLAVEDVNGDGKPDLLVVNGCALSGNCNVMGGSVGVLINTPVVTISGSPQQPLTKNADGDYVAFVTVTNTGNVTISSLHVTTATLGSGSLLSTPSPVTNLAPGATAVVTISFSPNSVPPGTTRAALKVNGTYSVTSESLAGNWSLTFRSVTL